MTFEAMWPRWYPLYRKTIKEYGLESRLASIRSIDVRPDTEALLQGKEDVVFGKLLEAGVAMRQNNAVPKSYE